MTIQQLNEANALQTSIAEKKKQIAAFERGKIKSITLRTFNDEDCTYEDYEMVKGVPRCNVKLLMVQVLKDDLKNLEYRFENLLSVEPAIEETSTNGL